MATTVTDVRHADAGCTTAAATAHATVPSTAAAAATVTAHTAAAAVTNIVVTPVTFTVASGYARRSVTVWRANGIARVVTDITRTSPHYLVIWCINVHLNKHSSPFMQCLQL